MAVRSDSPQHVEIPDSELPAYIRALGGEVNVVPLDGNKFLVSRPSRQRTAHSSIGGNPSAFAEQIDCRVQPELDGLDSATRANPVDIPATVEAILLGADLNAGAFLYSRKLNTPTHRIQGEAAIMDECAARSLTPTTLHLRQHGSRLIADPESTKAMLAVLGWCVPDAGL